MNSKNKSCSFFSKIASAYKDRSIRSQIIIVLSFSLSVFLFVFIVSTDIYRKTISTVEDSYSTNAELDKYLTLLTETQNAFQSYMQYRTFESIDKYYHYISLAEQKTKKLNDKPSSISTKQKEYIIRQLAQSFFVYSGNAVAARRANNFYETDFYYNKTRQCFSFLRDEIFSLNMMYFKSNAEFYEVNKSSTTSLLTTSVILITIIVVCVILFIYVGISQIVAPLSTISTVALKVADRDFDVELFNSTRKDEIGNICRAFDEMIISIREYIDTIWLKAKKENELREKEIEMRALITEAHFKALQEQIQPHFLFNTLNTGAGLAMMEGADKTCYFLEQVADFLRYNIQHPGHDASIEDELGMLDNYIYIMSVRFGNRYKFVKNIDDSLIHVRMPNMILQPLVENCIKHGLKDITENGKIKIEVNRDSCNNQINIIISDNGCGFDSAVKEKIMKLSKKREIISDAALIVKNSEINQNEHVSTGLVNVISRLQFYFKRNDVFSILSNEDGGTTFFLKIPDV